MGTSRKILMKHAMVAASSVLVLSFITSAANAGGFAIREQSTYGQGSSFAGIAAGGALSSMFWNPATITQLEGMNFEAGASLIAPFAKHTSGGVSVVQNSGDLAVLPATYFSYQVNDDLWFGMGFNTPFGLGVSFPKVWAGGAGSAYAQDSSVASINMNPNLAYKVNDWLSVAVGAQIQYMGVNYQNFLAPALPNLVLKGDGWGFGMTAGVTVKPLDGTTIGLGWRSAINQSIGGRVYNNVGLGTNGSIETTVRLPDTVTLGIRQDINDKFRVMGGVEWARWSRIGTTRIKNKGGGATLGPTGAQITLPFEYDDGWYFSFGGEYDVNEQVSVRAGIGYEISPVTDAVRTPRLPDNNRMWYSAGATVKNILVPNLSADIGYSFVDVESTPINVVAGNPWHDGATNYNGSVDSQVHIFSAALKYKF